MEFPLGQVVATEGIMNCHIDGTITPEEMAQSLRRHMKGDWGNLPEEDKQLNEKALEYGSRLFSKYTSEKGVSYYIITEASREVTTILLPSEY